MRLFITKYLPIALTLLITTVMSHNVHAQKYKLDNIDNQGFNVDFKNNDKIHVSHNISEFEIRDTFIDIEGIKLQSDAGSPNLPNNACFILIPNGANHDIELISYKEKTIENIEIEAAQFLKTDNDADDSLTPRNEDIYSKDAFFPGKLYEKSDNYDIRGYNIFLLNVNPFQYNPVKKTLKVYYDINLRVSFDTKDIEYGEDRLRSREWDEIIRNIVLNPDAIDDFDYDNNILNKNGCEYLILTPDNEGIRQWADTIAKYRNEQGILTKVMNINEIEENKPLVIKDFFKDIYDNWDIVPSSIMLFGDYSMDNNKGISSFYINDHPEPNLKYLTDNKLVDFNNDYLPEINISRLPVADAEEAEFMTRKIMFYESYPSTNPDYYEKPVTAMGFQESRWFQLCSEVVAGYFDKKGRSTQRLNAIYEGQPDSLWSSAPNTASLISHFGPEGLGYIPSDMRHLQEWDSNQDDLSKHINEGAFFVLHRDHGRYQNWGEPYFSNIEIDRLENEDLTFVMSANCQTGHFNYGGGSASDCFAERFLRTENGAVAVVAASEVSYSFVNDTYVWGYYDYLWNDFMPDFGDEEISFKYPSFANVYGKYFLKQSSWPYINDHKNVTFNLFHYFGDAYLQLNTEIPETIDISYPDTISSDCTFFNISKDKDTKVAFSLDGEIIARSTGSDSIINIERQAAGKRIKVVATKQDHYRHEGYIEVVSYLSEDELKVYPNPTRGEIFVESRNISRIVMSNALGQVIYKYDNNSLIPKEKIRIDCSVYKEKLFHLQIIYEDGRVISKTVISI